MQAVYSVAGQRDENIKIEYMKERTGFIWKAIIGIAGAVIGVLILMKIIPPPFGWSEIPVGLVSLFITPIYHFIDLLKKKKKEDSKENITVVQHGKGSISVVGGVTGNIGNTTIINNDNEPLIKKLVEVSEAKALAESEVATWKKNYNKLEAEYVNRDKLSDYKQHALELRAEGKKKEAIESVDTTALDDETANRHIFKAELLIDNFQFDEAEQHYKQAITIFPSYDNYFKIAVFYYNMNKFSEAIIYCNYCLNLATYQQERATVLNILAILHSNIDEYQKALKECEEALKIYRKLAKENPKTHLPNVMNTLSDLGLLHSDTNKYPEALEKYEEALNICRILVKENIEAHLPDVARTLSNLANLYRDTNKYSKALEEYEKALKIHRKLVKENSRMYLSNMATTLNNLAILYCYTNEYPKALKEFEEALSIYRSLAKENPKAYLTGVAMALNNLGLLHSNTNEYLKALDEYEEALNICRNLAEENPEAYLPKVANTLNNLAILHCNTNEYLKALNEYEEALEIYRKLAKKNPNVYLPKVANTLGNLSIFYIVKTAKKELSLKFANEAVEILSKCNNNPFVQKELERSKEVIKKWSKEHI